MVGSKQNNKLRLTIRYILATLLLLVMVYPYLYMVLNSFADWSQVDRKLIPASYSLKSYEWLFTGGETGIARPWLNAFVNSVIVSVVSTALMMLFGVMVAYALSKLNFKGRDTVNNFVLFHMFFPAIILLIPNFLIIQKVGLYDTYWAMIIPKAVSLWAIFMYTNFFKAIPTVFIEAAKLDGASDFKILYRIMMPMSRSITAVIFLFLLMERWTELLWDMIVVRSDSMLTLNVLLSQMFGPYGGYPGPLYAASVLLTLPIIMMFLVFGKKFKEGMQFSLK
ncbi:carbohydrate ABC transporter permease [Paenibacillus thiaminolyticus]|uniref:Carbohydrate ABC transporter permease n=1 Tax=Paenibacillus thiaminolyticus TaxID=49283 RepID=A0AAP9J2H7_PANTH|nr:carbohydrate ABC transporter permease [Paenibacillus thiaminolyticus]MCY9535933.1 carbohydrate ABC transporter permease [Paenibacillus thiaminolyticus]MCY9604257.1 carbohydrate ABC transporter permease [Paenibacillus thiaminolyticus]MCY9608798.1 carbohydrate ABC transporter permease [Paenibacillus thiaminolyticus]MCY9615587.1 carbohydrate ABC transporter permease [Paenibacillus thiaminolyticus]MCY9622194.1 carbohydrate ABC transporter permease [Paenibacillus thiaminolyticus]